MTIRDALIEGGIKNLKEYGYPAVNEKNILTDVIYSGFFKSMLDENRGFGAAIDEAINNLIAEIDYGKEDA